MNSLNFVMRLDRFLAPFKPSVMTVSVSSNNTMRKWSIRENIVFVALLPVLVRRLRMASSGGGKPGNIGVMGHTKGANNESYVPPVPSLRKLTGIKKFVLENSSRRRDFPIPDDWTIEQYGPYVISFVFCSTTCSLRASSACSPINGTSQDFVTANSTGRLITPPNVNGWNYLLPAIYEELGFLHLVWDHPASPCEIRLRIEK